MSSAAQTRTKYLLTCSSCGQAHPVDVSQAGQTLSCSCGQNLEVPTLRALRNLPTAKEQVERGEGPGWSRTQGIVFAGGLLLALLAFALGALLLYIRLQINTAPPQFDSQLEAQATIESLTVDQTWDFWVQLRDQGLGPYQTPPYIQWRQYAVQLHVAIAVSVLIGVLGLGAAAAAVLLRGRAT